MTGAGRPITTLHVDDEPDFADIGGTYLEQEVDRLTVHTATNTDDALELLADPALDVDGHFTFLNDALLDVTGYEEARILGEHASAVVPPEDVERGEELIRSLLTTDEDRATFEMDLLRSCGDGQEPRRKCERQDDPRVSDRDVLETLRE